MLQEVFSVHCSFCRQPLHLSVTGVSANRLLGGAMQLTFRRMAFDCYPFHWAGMRIPRGGSSSMAQVLKADPSVHPWMPRRRLRGLAAQEAGNSPLQEDVWKLSVSVIDDSLSLLRGSREGRQSLRYCFKNKFVF